MCMVHRCPPSWFWWSTHSFIFVTVFNLNNQLLQEKGCIERGIFFNSHIIGLCYNTQDILFIVKGDLYLQIFQKQLQMAFVAIGATMVGSITFTKNEGDSLKKGDEFGYFSFGGSTVVCVFEKDAIELDEDLLANSERALETLVSVGMTLGISKHLSKEQATNTRRPNRQDSVIGLDNEIFRNGGGAIESANVIRGHIGVREEEEEEGGDLV